jgi:hypothetical protein
MIERLTSARPRRALVPAAMAGLALSVAAVGCSSTSTTSTATGSTAPTTATTAAGGATGTTAGGPGTTIASGGAAFASIPAFKVQVLENGMDYRFDAPSSAPAGLVMFDLKNNGKQAHQVNVARPKGTATVEQMDTALKGPNPTAALALAEFVGASNTVAAGGEQRTVVQLEAGTYFLLCFVPDADGKDHLQHGMIQKIVVSAVGGAAGTTAKDAKDWLSQEKPTTPPPFTEAGGFGGLDKGNVGWVELDLAKGDYLALCFIPNTIPDPSGPPGPPDLKPHHTKGMITPFTID